MLDFTRLLGAVAMACTFAAGAWAQDYPRKPITIVSSAAPGGGVDAVTRLVGRALAEEWKQPVIVENRAGAGGMIGTEYVAKAVPDGYTLLTVSLGHATNPSLYRKMAFDTLQDLTPLSLLARLPVALVVTPSLPVTSVKELIAYAKANPDKLSCGSGGNGSSQHLACEMFKGMAGIKILHVPYRGVAAANSDLIGGQIQLMFDQISFASQNARSGHVKALAVTTAKRSPLMPDLPTMEEAGLPGYQMVTWFGLLGPANMPKAVVERFRMDLPRVMARPDIQQALEKQTFDPVFSGPGEFDTFLRQEMLKWDKVIKEAGIQPG
jgi:tripartite-type tricarboxylate transporter receptor subunit TctC